MDVKIENGWKARLSDEFQKPYFENLTHYIKEEYRNFMCFPPGKNIFEAFQKCPFDNVKVVILGQDPYHGVGQAHGLCFSVNDGIPFPPSLLNIFKEINADMNIPVPATGNLNRWAEQGILLLNATLSVRANEAGSHQKKGWEEFTDVVVQKLNTEKDNLVFMLWGSYAQNKGKIIDNSRHLVLKAAHPSPLSANRGGWFGTKHFSKCNEYLISNNQDPIKW